MKSTYVTLTSQAGITVEVATRLASAVMSMHSVVMIKCEEQIAFARNILSVLALSAAMGSTLEVQTFGEDERIAGKVAEAILSGKEESGED